MNNSKPKFHNKRKEMTVAEKLSKSYDGKLNEVKNMNLSDKARIFEDFEIELRKNAKLKEFKNMIHDKLVLWKEKLIKYKAKKDREIRLKTIKLAKKLKLKAGSSVQKQEEIMKERQKKREKKLKEIQEAQMRSRRKIQNHMDLIEKERVELDKSVTEKCMMMEKRNQSHLNNIRSTMHDRLDKSFTKNSHNMSIVRQKYNEELEKKEEAKFMQFHDFYFFYKKQEKIKKDKSQQRVDRMSSNVRAKNRKLSQMKGKNDETMEKIAKAVENKELIYKERHDELENKGRLLEKHTKQVFKNKDKLDVERYNADKQTMQKQMSFINNNAKREELAILNHQYFK